MSIRTPDNEYIPFFDANVSQRRKKLCKFCGINATMIYSGSYTFRGRITDTYTCIERCEKKEEYERKTNRRFIPPTFAYKRDR